MDLRTVAVDAVLDAVRSAAIEDPARAAIDDGNRTITRAELYASALRLATEIAAAVPRGTPIGVALGNDAPFWIAALACAAAGCPHVALDVSYPAVRNADILRRAATGAVIEYADAPFESGTPLRRIRFGGSSIVSDAAADLSRALDVDEPFAIMYTSGSTGAPKGVVHSQRSLLHSVIPDIAALQLGGDDRALGMWSPSTIAGVRAALSSIYAGARAVLRDPHTGLGSIIATMRDEQITVCRSVPALMRAIARTAGARDAMRTLRVVQLGGERVYGTDIALLRALLPPSCRISIGFGSTEAGVIAQWFVDREPSGVIATGYAIAGTVLEVVDGDGIPVAPGEIGELQSCGPATALGRWEDGRIIPDGFVPSAFEPHARTYRTGDLFRRRPDGLLEHAGRADRMIKRNGRRVDLGDIEAALRGLPGVRDAAVVAAMAGGVRITAFAELQPPATEPAVRAQLAGILPQHMVPHEVRAVDAIPLLPGFKPDIAALERMAAERRAEAASGFRPAAKADEVLVRAVARAWRLLLNRASFERDERWDDAGGDSLLMLQLAHEIESALGEPVPLEAMSPQMRPSELIARLAHAEAAASPETFPTIVMLPGLMGDEPRLVSFRRHLGERDVFVPAYPAWDRSVRDGERFETVVDAVYAQIRERVPAGPYVLCGFSFGGLVAHETARRLRVAGETVAFVGLIDSSLTGVAWAQQTAWSPLERMRRIVRDVRREGVRSTFAVTAGYRLALMLRGRAGLRRAVAKRRLKGWFAFDFYMTWFTRLALAAAFKPCRLDVPVTLFRTARSGSGDPGDLGWLPYVRHVRVENVGGTHLSMLEGDEGKQLASRLRRAIADADAAWWATGSQTSDGAFDRPSSR